MYIIHNGDKVCLNEHSQVREIQGIFKVRKYENRKKNVLIMKVFENSNASFTPLCYFFSILRKGFDFKIPTLDLKILS